ncbi:hypothetical protein HDU84_006988 [Entophlyctis sp. JEL0112]|nr:hypothetical protein HDU84_006988 [Entophlyctis sp. JEL0112]
MGGVADSFLALSIWVPRCLLSLKDACTGVLTSGRGPISPCRAFRAFIQKNRHAAAIPTTPATTPPDIAPTGIPDDVEALAVAVDVVVGAAADDAAAAVDVGADVDVPVNSANRPSVVDDDGIIAAGPGSDAFDGYPVPHTALLHEVVVHETVHIAFVSDADPALNNANPPVRTFTQNSPSDP